jgi:hypothetical protein
MTISMYDALIPLSINNLENLSAILAKAESHAQSKKIDESIFINARLFPDMLPFSRQVQIACDTTKAGAARLAEIEVPNHPDVEKTFRELQTRINKTIEFLKTIKPAHINGKEELKISYIQREKEKNFIGLPYLLNHILPNIFFHITTAYAILRHNGIEIGKKDFLGN